MAIRGRHDPIISPCQVIIILIVFHPVQDVINSLDSYGHYHGQATNPPRSLTLSHGLFGLLPLFLPLIPFLSELLQEVLEGRDHPRGLEGVVLLVVFRTRLTW